VDKFLIGYWHIGTIKINLKNEWAFFGLFKAFFTVSGKI